MTSPYSADSLFHRYFLPQYRPEDIARRPFTKTLPDSFEAKVRQEHLVRQAVDVVAALDQIRELVDMACNDFGDICKATSEFSLDALITVDEYFSFDKIKEIVDRSDPDDHDNEYCYLVAEMGAFVGTLLINAQPEARWFVDWPLWECCVRKTDIFIPVFHWSIRRLSADAELLGPKYSWICDQLLLD